MPGGTWAGDSTAATPYRPTLSNPAELSATGWLELEMGWLRTRGDGTRRHSLPYTAKVAFDEDWGILVGGEGHIRESIAGDSQSGFGDTSFTLKRRFATADENLNFGLEGGIKTPTARHRLGSGKADWTINGIASLDFAESWRLDANLGLTRLGARNSNEGRVGTLWATALSKSFGDWGLAAEYSGTHQRDVPNGRQWLVAASYTVTPHLVFDVGGARNRQGGETERSLFFGLTWLTAKLF